VKGFSPLTSLSSNVINLVIRRLRRQQKVSDSLVFLRWHGPCDYDPQINKPSIKKDPTNPKAWSRGGSMDNNKVIDLKHIRSMKNTEEGQLIRQALEDEKLRETRKEMEQLFGMERRALELENGMPEYSFDWAEQLRSLSEQEIKDYAAAAARLALIARALHTEEWHVLYREVALFSLVLLEQLEYSRGMLRKMGLDESLIKLER
jgi:hypothetical protein